jgi:hypothetical protein
MDPYLETPNLWPDVHHELIAQIRSALNPRLRPAYVARVELRVYVTDQDDPGLQVLIPDVRVEKAQRARKQQKTSSSPSLAVAEPIILPHLIDDEIKEARLEIRERASNALVTMIEVLSPANKVRGSRGRTSLLEKRRDCLACGVHWVEIDLLRAGEPTLVHPPLEPCDYRIIVWPMRELQKPKYWPVSLRQALPVIGIPLRGDDPDVPLDLTAVLQAAYDRGAYDLSIDYGREPDPPLPPGDAAWADTLLRERGLRSGRKRNGKR